MEGIRMVYAICILIGISAGVVGSLLGLGGGIVLVPSLLFIGMLMDGFAWATPQAIVGISMFTMFFTAVSSTISYAKAKRIDFRTGLMLLSGSIPGGILGSWLNQFVDTDGFLLYYGILLVVIFLLFFIKKEPRKEKRQSVKKALQRVELEGKTYEYHVPFLGAFVLTLAVGMLSGLFGIGGGAMVVPALVLLFGMPVHLATATSMFMIVLVSVGNTLTHVALDNIMWEYVFWFIPGAWIGGKLGAALNQRLSGAVLEYILRLAIIILGIRMIYEGLS